MTPAVFAAAVAGMLAGAGLGALAPDIAWLAGRIADRLRDHDPAVSLRRLDRIVPVAIGLGVVLLLLGAPAPGAGVAGGPALLRLVLGARRVRRRKAVAVAAPVVARAVADGLDAGYGVRRSITEAARAAGVSGPAADELRSIAARLHAGDPLPASLHAWSVRTDEPAHATLVAGLLLHGEAGGELADVLRDQAESLERARRATAEAESAIVQARTAARIVGGIPAVGMVAAVVLAPESVRQITGTTLGAVLVVLAILLQLTAMVAVRRLTVGLAR